MIWPETLIFTGSSPQARGTRLDDKQIDLDQRFIPAGAGNTSLNIVLPSADAVHPRRRGEHTIWIRVLGRPHGSSPQARGTLHRSDELCLFGRFIPAGAGNTSGVVVAPSSVTVHPRRRGEHPPPPAPMNEKVGSSPQARGTPLEVGALEVCARFIPAGAGNTALEEGILDVCAVHPRRRGEHLCSRSQDGWMDGSSPQARGTRWRDHDRLAELRFIPAGAGNTV